MASNIGSKIMGGLGGILIGLIVISFAVWGINDVFSPNATNAVISLGKHEVSTQDFDRQFRRELTTMASRDGGRQLTHQEAYDRGVHQRVLQKMLSSKVVEIDALDLGIGVNSRSAMDYVSDFEAFKDEITGKFSRSKLESVLARQNPQMTLQDFEQDLILDLRQQQTFPAISGGITAPVEYAELAYQYMTEQRKAQVLTFTANIIEVFDDPSDEVLREYVNVNPIPFTAPEYRRVSILRLETTDVTPNLSVTEEELRDHFEYRLERGDYGSPETRSVVEIITRDETTANEAVSRLEAGEDAETVATLLNLIEPTVFEDVLPTGITDPDTAEVAFAMQEGDVKAVVNSLGVWSAIKVTKVTPKVEPDFDSVRSDLEDNLMTNKAKDKLFDITEAIEDALDDGDPLEDAARAANVSYATIDFIDRSGTTRDERKMSGTEAIPGVAGDETILTEIFTSDAGFETDLFETSTGGWAAIRVDDVIDSQMRPFEEVRDQALSMWRAQRLSELMDEKMVELVREVKDGKTLEVLAAEMSENAFLTDVVLVRSSPPNTLGPLVVAGLLEADVGDVERGTGPVPSTRQIAVLTDIIVNTDGLAGQFAELMQAEATAAIRQDLSQAYQTAVIAENPYKTYPDQVTKVLGLDTAE